MASGFMNNKLIKVTPGVLSNYVNDGTADNISETVDHRSAVHDRVTIPARFKIYLHQLKISRQCLNHIKQEQDSDIFLTLKWVILEFQGFITSPEKLDHNKTKFDFTIKYQVEVDENFVNKVNENPVIFQLYAVCNGQEMFLSEAQFFIDNVIEFVNVKQQQRVYFTSNVIDPSGNIGYLDMWYKFTCKQKTLKTLFPTSKVETKKKTTTRMSDLLGDAFSKNSQNLGTVYVTDSEFDHFADSVLLVLNRNKVLKTTQSDINTELQERVRWLRFEANWKQTLQENAILHGKNPEDVNWRQWREEDTTNVRLRTYDAMTPKTYKPELTITIVDLYFLEGCHLLRNENINQFYVQYSFLGQEGPEMETPFSIPKKNANEKVIFNFTKKFPIDLEKNYKNCKLLAELIKQDGIIKLMVISEPLESLDHPIQTCQEVGFAEVPFSELIQLEENVDQFEYEIIDINNTIAVLGFIAIKVEGILAMRKMALNLMSPKDYKLYM